MINEPNETKPVPCDSLDTHRFSLDKRLFRVRFENETENHVDVVIEPREVKQ